jgi:hypothetical protein
MNYGAIDSQFALTAKPNTTLMTVIGKMTCGSPLMNNKKKAETIIYMVCQYVDARPPEMGMESMIDRIVKTIESKCSHDPRRVKRIDHKEYGNAEFHCDDCDEPVTPVKFEGTKI